MAVQRFGLRIEAQSVGEEQVAKLEAALNKVLNATDRMNQKSAQSAKTAGDSLKKSVTDYQNVIAQIDSGIRSPLQTASAAATQFAASLGPVGVGLTAVSLGVGAVAAASVKFVASVGGVADQMANLAERTGLTVNQVDRLQAMARLADVNIESLEESGKQLALALEDATGSGRRAAEALERLNISAFDLSGNQRELGPLLLETLKRLGEIENQSERVALANAILGGGSRELLPLIRNFKELEAAVAKLGFGMDEVLLGKLGEAGDKLDELSLRWDLLKRKLAEPATAVVDVLVRVADFASGATRSPALRFGLGTLTPFSPFIREANTLFGPAIPPPPAPLPNLGELQPSIEALVADRERGRRLSEAFRAQFARSPEGLRERLASIEEELAEARKRLSSNPAGKIFDEIKRGYDALLAERAQIEQTLQDLEEERRRREQSAKFQANIPTPAVRPRVRPSLLPRVPGPSPFRAPAMVISEEEMERANATRAAIEQQRLQAFGEGLLRSEIERRERAVRAIRSELEFETRKIELLSGPGGEIQAVERLTELRLRGLEEIRRVTGDTLELELERTEILRDRELELMRIRNESIRQYRDNVVQAFDALISGGRGGFSAFLRSQGLGIARQVVGNLAEMTFSSVAGRLTLPGQGTATNPTFLGRILAGTPFGLSPEKVAVDQNTTATIQNTQAIAAMTGVLTGRPAGTIAGTMGPLFSGAQGLGGLIFNNNAGSTANVPAVQAAQSARLSAMQWLGMAGAAAGGAFGILSGVRQGGARGALTAAAAGSGAASGILSIAGVAGPAAPVLAGIGLGLGIITSLFGDPKQQRDEEINRLIASRQFTEPTGTSFFKDISGRMVDYDQRGQIRIYNVTQNFDVQAMDARSFIDNRAKIADAMRMSIQEGHPVNQEMRAAILPV